MIPLRVGTFNFESVINYKLPAILLFGATYDRGSVALYEKMKFSSEKFEGKFIVGYVDIDYAIELFCRYEVIELPTLIAFEDGVPTVRESGYTGSRHLRNFIHKFYGVLPDISEFKSPVDRYWSDLFKEDY